MVINDFSTLMQLAATLSIAFVAVEYANAFTHTLADNVFKFKDLIKESFKQCHDILEDKETLNHLDPVIINGVSTSNQIEKVKRSHEIISKEVDSEEKRLEKNIEKICESKSLSSTSLWFFLYCTTSLFLSGLEGAYLYCTKSYWSVLFILTLFFSVAGWICGERDKQIKYVDYTLLRHCVYYFGGVSVFSLVITFILSWCGIYFSESSVLWNIILISSVILPYINFVVYFVKTKYKAKTIKSEITSSASSMKDKCLGLKKEVEDLLSVSRVTALLVTKD